MKRLILALAALLMAPVPAGATTTLVRVNGSYMVGVPCTLADGSSFLCPAFTQVDSSGAPVTGGSTNISQFGGSNVVTGTGTGGSGIPRVTVSNDSSVVATQATASNLNAQVVGNVAAASSDSGNPLKIGGVATGNSAPSAVTAGQRVNAWFGTFGQLFTGSYAVTGADGAFNLVGTPLNQGGSGALNSAAEYGFNGATWDPVPRCNSFAAVSVTAGNTTQIVALSGSTVVRVCTVVLGISANGSFAMVSGTGSNCATPANSTGDIPLNTGSPLTLAAGGGGPVYRGSSAGEFCVKATTGNVTGYVMYAQY